MKNVRGKYPVTLTELRKAGRGGVAWDCFVKLNPPDYRSKSGRVKRWAVSARERRGEGLYYLAGHKIASMTPQLLCAGTWPRRIRAFGSYTAVMDLLKIAVKSWHDLPCGQEIETLMARMFPLKLELEVTPLVVKPGKPKRRKAA